MHTESPASKIEIGHTYQAIDERRVILKIIPGTETHQVKAYYNVEVIHPGTCSKYHVGDITTWGMFPENWIEIKESIYDTLCSILEHK